MIGGVRITVSPYALETTEQRLFPDSRNRSRRIHKKLVKRFGGEFRQVPAIFQTPLGFVAHPAMYAKLKAELAAYDNRQLPHMLGSNPW